MSIQNRVFTSIAAAVFLLLSAVTPAYSAVPDKMHSATDLISQQHLVTAFDTNEEPLSFHPHKSTNINSAQIFTAITEGLVVYDPETMQPIPGNASSITPSEDQKTWTIKVRRDARFSNGDKITAKTYRDSWLHMLAPDNPGDMASLLDMVKGVKKYRKGLNNDPSSVGIRLKDLYTLEIELITPSPYLMRILCHHAFAPVHPYNLTKRGKPSPDSFISSGPFTITEHSGETIYLEQNPHYWDTSAVKLESIRIELRQPSMKLVSEFSEGLVHWSETYLDISLLLDQEHLQVFPEYSTSFFYFSAEKGPYADPKVRRAMALLIPWDKVRSASASVFKTDSLVPQDYSYHGNNGITDRDRQEAMRLLKRSGYPEGKNLPLMEIAIYPNARLEKMTDIITDVWSRELGITIVIDVVPFSYYIDKSDHPYAMAYLTWIGDFYDPYSFLSLWTSDSSFNPGSYSNNEYDALIEKALRQGDEEKRYERLAEAEQLLLDTAAVIPISHGVSINFVDTDILKGWYPNLLNIHPFKRMQLDPSSDSSQRL